LFSFNNTGGGWPYAGLLQGTDGNFYGTTVIGGVYFNNCGGGGCGAVFKITPNGTLTTLYSFCAGGGGCTDGATPYGGLVEGTDGDFYGTTEAGGPNPYACGGEYGCGTVFKITPSGKLTTLHSFGGKDGSFPYGGLIQGADRKFYGTTSSGGISIGCSGSTGCGTVFSITAKGELTTLYSLCQQSNCTDGLGPYAGLVQGRDGNFYGTTIRGGTNECEEAGATCGTVFKITPTGTLTTLYSFDDMPNGEYPYAGLVQGADGNFYGTAYQGGASNDGTVFKITSSGTLTVLHSFDGTDGRLPNAALVQGTDGNFYGTTYVGGANGANNGTIFEITSAGVLTTLYSFAKGTDGQRPDSPVVQGTNGTFYGTTYWGGAYQNCIAACGTVFSESVGLGPFVKTLPASGKVGMAVKILGNDLTSATSVTFNGTAATFAVVSGSEIKTSVPLGATTGKVRVTFPHGTRSSNVPFRVIP
jgi:uncharacterized repeat protein (TIGR03803 family)